VRSPEPRRRRRWRAWALLERAAGARRRHAAGGDRQRHVHHVEGAVARVGDGETAIGRRDSRYIVNTIGMWADPSFRDGEIAAVRATGGALKEFSPGGAYLNFLDADEGDERIRAAYGPEKYARLVALKDRYDPDNVFRLNQNIRPSREQSK
jgi:hypothetical protein